MPRYDFINVSHWPPDAQFMFEHVSTKRRTPNWYLITFYCLYVYTYWKLCIYTLYYSVLGGVFSTPNPPGQNKNTQRNISDGNPSPPGESYSKELGHPFQGKSCDLVIDIHHGCIPDAPPWMKVPTSPFQGIPIRSDDDDDDDGHVGRRSKCWQLPWLPCRRTNVPQQKHIGYIIHLYNIKAKLVASFLAFWKRTEVSQFFHWLRLKRHRSTSRGPAPSPEPPRNTVTGGRPDLMPPHCQGENMKMPAWSRGTWSKTPKLTCNTIDVLI